ncbi:unnamed protein product [Taenia asiatica]|uniref:Uncharacterized protein n=1 Tax=Taenia asiatica TaxID=60517 RepID=A0A0R3WFC3_TAEAS|nr:unnamed protein product [Taenia asiatica]
MQDGEEVMGERGKGGESRTKILRTYNGGGLTVKKYGADRQCKMFGSLEQTSLWSCDVDYVGDSGFATETVMSAFELVVVDVDSCGVATIRSIGPAEIPPFQCWLLIHHGNKERAFALGGLMND